MYFSLSQTSSFTTSLLTHLTSLPVPLLSQLDIFIIPDFISLVATATQLQSAPVPIWSGAQDVHWEDRGAYTGEVSPSVLREAGVRIVEVGHAERRRFFGEDDGVVARKAGAVSRNGMVPLVCIGEQTKGDINIAISECQGQIEPVMASLPPTADVVLAYEPVWAIGASKPAQEDHVLAVVEGIRSLECVRTRECETRIVYGGSAGPGLYERLKGGLDGLFLGRFGHDPEMFVKTIREVAEA